MLIVGIKSLFKEEQKDSIKVIDPFRLTLEQNGKIGMLKKVLEVKTDKKKQHDESHSFLAGSACSRNRGR